MRTTSWDESMLVSSTVGGEKSRGQGGKGQHSLLDAILGLRYKRWTTWESRGKVFPMKEIPGNLSGGGRGKRVILYGRVQQKTV